MLKNTKLAKQKILARIDLINKFSLSTSFKDLNIEKIRVQLHTNDLLSRIDLQNEKSIMPKINSFLLLYIISGVFPFIIFIKKKTEKRSLALSNRDLFISFVEITNSSNVSKLLSQLVLETNFLDKSLKLDKINTIAIQKNIFSYNTKITGNQFYQAYDFFGTNNNEFNFNSVSMSINFICNNFSTKIFNSITTQELLCYKIRYL